MVTNKVLLRQIKKSKITNFDDISKEQFEKFLELVEASYQQMDGNTYRLERALEVSSNELRELNDNLEIKVQDEIEKNREKDRQLIEQSRFAALGEMIGNIAHQWRQPLSAISSTASGMSVQIDLQIASNEDIKESYTNILSYVSFLTQTIEDFRGFFKENRERTQFNIIDVVNQTLSIISSAYKDHDIKLIHNLPNEDKLIIDGYPSELAQVFLNILNNAKDAISSKEQEDKYVSINYKKEDGHYLIYIDDNAGGVPKSIINKIFDPYFTTKHKSQGTGIGLYMSKDIIETHMHGSLNVENRENRFEDKSFFGASFKISLPIK